MMPYRNEKVIVDTGNSYGIGVCTVPQPQSVEKYDYEPESLIELSDSRSWVNHDNLYEAGDISEHSDHDLSVEDSGENLEVHCHRCAEVISEVEK